MIIHGQSVRQLENNACKSQYNTMRLLRFIYGITIKNKIKYTMNKEQLGVTVVYHRVRKYVNIIKLIIKKTTCYL